MDSTLKALILGDIIGQSGCRALFILIKDLIKKHAADFVIANGENAADGFGLTPELMEQLLTGGIDVITSGNHIWQKKDIYPHLDSNARLLRPENYPPGVPGKGTCVIEKRGMKIGVANLQGRVRLSDLDCPFRSGDKIVKKLRKETPAIVVDFHAEDSEEKEALALYLDGRVSVVAGTHTHIQTGDERILAGGTGYITDIGMIGPQNSVIGFNSDTAVRRSQTQLPMKIEVSDNPAVLQGICVTIDSISGKTVEIERISELSRL